MDGLFVAQLHRVIQALDISAVDIPYNLAFHVTLPYNHMISYHYEAIRMIIIAIPDNHS